jgi:hypothetical protein
MQLDMAFYDGTKTGDISSRLSADTNSASDQISLCVNVAMRSSTQVRFPQRNSGSAEGMGDGAGR